MIRFLNDTTNIPCSLSYALSFPACSLFTFHMKFCSLMLMSLLLHLWIELRCAGGFEVCITIVSKLYANIRPRIYDLRSYFFGRPTITHFSKSFAVFRLLFFFHFHLSLVDCYCCILLGKAMIMIVVYYFGWLNYYYHSHSACTVGSPNMKFNELHLLRME